MTGTTYVRDMNKCCIANSWDTQTKMSGSFLNPFKGDELFQLSAI
jgi:hypothetical protein